MQRLRVTFARGEEVKYLSHLDLMRLWERSLRRASIPVAYSQGFSPHPRISIAAPLPMGVTGECELMDITLIKRMSPYQLLKVLVDQLPNGMSISNISQVSHQLPSLQSQVRRAEYHVVVQSDREVEDVENAVKSFLSLEGLPWQHERDREIRSYDLRALVEKLWLMAHEGHVYKIGMWLRIGSGATGRAEQVALALGFTERPVSIHRTRLFLAGEQ